jgi:transketolase
VAWQTALKSTQTPTVLALSRQALPSSHENTSAMALIARGGYVLRDCKAPPDAIVIATGSEVAIALAASQSLAAEGIETRVVSMPSTFRFDRQPTSYRVEILPPGIPRVAVEAGITEYWRKYVGLEGGVVGIDRFGESAPPDDLFAFFELTAEAVAACVRKTLESEA